MRKGPVTSWQEVECQRERKEMRINGKVELEMRWCINEKTLQS